MKDFTVENYCALPMCRNSPWIRSQLRCVDGYSMSVQHSPIHYCEKYLNDDMGIIPTEDSTFEVWCCSEFDVEFADFWEDDSPMGWVPFEIVAKVVAKHGGLI